MVQVLPTERAREYETIFILHPDTPSDVMDTVATRCQNVISRLQGKLLRAENWGCRKLAYPVKKNPKGMYVYLRYLGYQDLVHELERNFRAMDSVMKFLTVKIDEDVNPEARPVSDSDISFVSTFVEEESTGEEKPTVEDSVVAEVIDTTPETPETPDAVDTTPESPKESGEDAAAETTVAEESATEIEDESQDA